jgi:DNA-binding NtrC family response regulator
MRRPKVLIVDDEAGVRFGLRDFLETKGYAVEEADSCDAAEAACRAGDPDIVLLDYLLPDGNALELLPRLRVIDEHLPVVVLTAHGSIDVAVRAIKDGAEHFLTKPVELPSLLVIVERVLEVQRGRQKQLALGSRTRSGITDPFIGVSAAARQLAADAERIAAADSPVLILGETGTGKGLLARWLHDHGPRAAEAFVDINCAGLSREFLETELFGHEKGAFTGAVGRKPGLLEVAHHGTVFLDEIGDADLQIQPRLLKVLEEKRFRRLGEVRDRTVDIRLIAATHRDLTQLVREQRFRSDLYFRISTIPLVVSALRERRDDIPILARRILQELAADVGRGDIELTPDADEALARYPWPGNIRELRNVLERALLLSDRPLLGARDLRFEAAPQRMPTKSEDDVSLRELERRHIERVLREERGHVERAASRLGIPRSTLYQKLKAAGITVSRL